MGQEDPLEKELATHSSILAWRIPWTEEPVGYSLCGPKESDTTEQLKHIHTDVYHIFIVMYKNMYFIHKNMHVYACVCCLN